MKDSLNIAIAGATGYVGLELIKILSKHPKVKIVYLCAQKSIGKNISFFDKGIKKKFLPKISKIKKINWNKINVLFTALPNGEAQKIAKIIPPHILLIDLSADFRLIDHKLYKKWYGINHKCKKLIKKSIYAITEFSRNKLNNQNIISCPGCYPTSIQLPLISLVRKKMINTSNIVIDAKSGYSGAGKNIHKKFNFKSLFNSPDSSNLSRLSNPPIHFSFIIICGTVDPPVISDNSCRLIFFTSISISSYSIFFELRNCFANLHGAHQDELYIITINNSYIYDKFNIISFNFHKPLLRSY